MSFIEPWYLLGGLAALIPVVIHLLKLNKPETVAFSTLAFFKELTDTTVKRLNIKRWLLLLFRVLAILALTLALAQPTAKNAANAALNGSQNALWLLIDNSLSTGLSDDKGVRLYRLTEQAKSWIEQLNDDANVYLNVTHGKWEYSSALEPKEAIQLLNQIQPSKGADFFGIRLKEMMQNMIALSAAGNEVHILHDGQYLSLENTLESLKKEVNEADWGKLKIGYLQQNGEIANSWIKHIGTTNSWVSANKKMNIKVDLGQSASQNSSASPDSSFVNNQGLQKLAIYVNNRMISEQAITTNEATLNASFTPTEAGDYALKAVISGDSYVLDNSYFTVLKVPESLKILWVTDNYREQDRSKSSFYNALNAANLAGYALDIDAVAADNIPVERLASYKVVIMEAVSSWPTYADAAIRDYVQQLGGGLWLIPSSTTNLSIWNKKVSALGLPIFEGIVGEYASYKKQTSLERIRANHPIFQGMFNDSQMEEQGWSPVIDSPSLYYYYKMGDLAGSYALLQTEERNPILVEKKLGNGVIWSMAMGFEPAWSDLSIKAIFAPLIFNGINFLNTANEGSFFSEKALVAPLQFSSPGALLSNSAILNDSIQVSLVREQAISSFNYQSIDPSLAAGIIQLDSAQYGLNAPKWESEPDYFSLDQFLAQDAPILAQNESMAVWNKDFISNTVYELDDVAQNTASFSSTKSLPIWTWLALLALLFLLIESLISRYFKVQGAKSKSYVRN